MILEVVSIRVHAGQSADYEASFKQAGKVIAQAKGYISHELQRSVDMADHYLVLVKWHTRDDHMIGFRESPLFIEWRKLLGPFFAATPEMEHYELVG
jgi:heme-degrading monooxygenase HmoA